MAYDRNNVFARILRGELPCNRVYEDAHVLAFRDINPQAPTHIVVIPKGEYVSVDDFSANASGSFKIGVYDVNASTHMDQNQGVDSRVLETEANRILDKILVNGADSLTPEEKETMRRYSESTRKSSVISASETSRPRVSIPSGPETLGRRSRSAWKKPSAQDAAFRARSRSCGRSPIPSSGARTLRRSAIATAAR